MTEPGVTSIYGKWPGISAEDKERLGLFNGISSGGKMLIEAMSALTAYDGTDGRLRHMAHAGIPTRLETEEAARLVKEEGHGRMYWRLKTLEAVALNENVSHLLPASIRDDIKDRGQWADLSSDACSETVNLLIAAEFCKESYRDNVVPTAYRGHIVAIVERQWSGQFHNAFLRHLDAFLQDAVPGKSECSGGAIERPAEGLGAAQESPQPSSGLSAWGRW